MRGSKLRLNRFFGFKGNNLNGWSCSKYPAGQIESVILNCLKIVSKNNSVINFKWSIYLNKSPSFSTGGVPFLRAVGLLVPVPALGGIWMKEPRWTESGVCKQKKRIRNKHDSRLCSFTALTKLKGKTWCWLSITICSNVLILELK